MKKPTILLINPGPPRKRSLLEDFCCLPVTLFVLADPGERWVESLIPPGHIKFCNVTNGTAVIQAATEFETHFDGAGTYYEPSVLSAAYLCRQFGLRGPSPDAVERSSISKANMRQALRRVGLAVPDFAVFSSLEDLPVRADEIGYPCVLKPAAGADSQSVRKIETRSDAVALSRQETGLRRFRETSYWAEHDPRWMVERYLAGVLFSIDGYISDGCVVFIGATETELGPEPFFNIEANWIPPRLPEPALDETRAQTTRIVHALGLDNAAFHAEFRLTASGPRLVEIAARFAGGVMHQGYRAAYGIDPAEILVELWLGHPVVRSDAFETVRFVLQKGVFPREEGILQVIENIDEACEMPELFEFVQVARVGEPLLVYPQASVPIYFYGMAADNHGTLLSASRHFERMITWKTVSTTS